MHILTKRGNLDNVITYEHICDTTEDMAFIEQKYITLGSTCVVLQGEGGGMEVYMADSNKEWHDIMVTGGNETTTAGLELHVCTAAEVQNGKPNVDTPLESTLYLVPSGSESGNLYDEYVYVNQQWELFGGARINMNGYATESWVQQQNYLTRVPHATSSEYGTIKLGTGLAPIVDAQGNDQGIGVLLAPNSIIKQGTQTSWAVPVSGTDAAAFYGLAKAAGDTTQAQSSNTVGTYTDAAKTAIQGMLDVPSNNALAAVDTLPTPGANGTGLVSVNGEWVQQSGYGYSVTEDSFVLGEFTSADFTQKNTEYVASITLTSELLTLLQRMFMNHEEFNVTINDTTYNSVADQFTYTEDPSIYLQDVFRLEPNFDYTALDFFVPTAPSSARIYGSVTTYTQFDRRLLPEQELNVKNGTGNGSIVVSGNDGAFFNKATGNHSVAEGYATIAGSSTSHTEGYYSMAVNGYTGYGSSSNANHSEGYSTASVGIGSHSEGSSDYYVEHIYITGDENATELSYGFSTGATRQLDNQIIGAYLIYSGEDADLEGAFYRITGLDSSRQIIQVSQGHPAFSNASFRILDNFAVGDGAHTEGNGTQAFRDSSHAEGLKTIANGEAQHVQGKYNIEDTNNTYAHIVGNGTSNTRSNAHTLDWSGNGWFAGKVSVGTVNNPVAITNPNDLTTKVYVDTKTSGNSPIESGTGVGSIQTKQYTFNNDVTVHTQSATGDGSIAIGIDTFTSGMGAFAEGEKTVALAEGAHAEGCYTAAAGEGAAHAEGYGTIFHATVTSKPEDYVYVLDLHGHLLSSVQWGMIAEWNGQYAEIGDVDVANNSISIYKNWDNVGVGDTINIYLSTASGWASHIEGVDTFARYDGPTHAEGLGAAALAEAAHAEGWATVASGTHSHAEGSATIADSDSQHVSGKFNIVDSDDTYAEIVGNGTDASTRSNARTLDWNGNAWYAGKVTADGTPTNANDLTTKQYVDNAINGSTVSVSGTTPTITADANTMYVCGEVSALSFTPAATGISDIIFESGSTATVLTIPNTVKFPDWFDATALEPNMVYEISIMNGTYGAVMAWATT